MSTKKVNDKKKTMKNNNALKTIVKIDLRKKNDLSTLNILPHNKSSEPSETKEFIPNITKREISSKKIILKAKPNLKRINKRKGGCPKQNVNYVEQITRSRMSFIKYRKENENCKKLSVAEIIHLMDVGDNLTEEDFMDILNCPSPVWWEHDQNLTTNLDDIPEPKQATSNPPTQENIPIKTEKKDEINTIIEENPLSIKTEKKDEINTIIEENPLSIKTEKKDEIDTIIEENPLSLPHITEEKFEQIFLEKRLSLEKLLSGIKNNENKNENDFSVNEDLYENSIHIDEISSIDEYTDIEELQNVSDISFNTSDDNNDNKKDTFQNKDTNSDPDTIKDKLNSTNKSNSNSSDMEIYETDSSITNKSTLNEFENKQKKSDEMVECLLIEGSDISDPCCSKSLEENNTSDDTDVLVLVDTDGNMHEPTKEPEKLSPKQSNKKAKSPKKCNNDNNISKNTSRSKNKVNNINNREILDQYVSILKSKMLKKNLENKTSNNFRVTHNNTNNNKCDEQNEMKEKCNTPGLRIPDESNAQIKSFKDDNQETLKT